MTRSLLSPAEGRTCPACGGHELWRSGNSKQVRAVCEYCGTCWDRTEEPWTIVDSIACAGCEESGVCESRPTAAARAHSVEVEIADGTVIVIRLLLRGDRTQLQQAYEHLSEASKQLRFFLPPKHLSDAHLAYLTDLDYDQRFALVAYGRDDPSHRGLAVARWVRDHEEPTRAEAAVVVVDDMQGRGIGTALLRTLVREAVDHGITTFTADIRWDNRKLLEKLAGLGAAIRPAEPGVADVELRLPITDDDLGGPALHHLFLTAAGQS